jgi:hypothetical protein
MIIAMPVKAGIRKLIDTTGFRLSQETGPAFPVLPPSMAVAPE